MNNPFNITFGELPLSLISRNEYLKIVKDTFNVPNPLSKVYIITGPRGCGKTLFLTMLCNEFKKDDYIVVDLNPFLGLEEQFVAKLYAAGKLKKLFLHPEFSFSFKGISFSLKGDEEINDISTLIDKMLSYLKKKGKRVLISIDDIAVDNNVKTFVYSYQQMLRDGHEVFFLMSGLYENVSQLSVNNKLTFLLRAPKLFLEPLNIYDVIYFYKKTFSLSNEEAVKYAQLTKGYAYGFQLLGSLLYKYGTSTNFLEEYDSTLNRNAYALTYVKLTDREKAFLKVLSETSDQKEMQEKLKMNNGNLQTYKRRLTDKGLIYTKSRGKLDFALPRFKEFIRLQIELESDDFN